MLKWTIGLIDSSNRYLTGEKFQSKVNCNGTTLKTKQIWTLESQKDEVWIALKSSVSGYLTSDNDGKLDCSGDEVGDEQKFVFETQEDGRVAIKNVKSGRYIKGSADNLSGFGKDIGDAELYTIRLAIHPQVNIRNKNRKRYIHYSEEEEALCCNEDIPWGYDAVVILEFHENKYALRAANTKYLSCSGKLTEAITKDCLFTIVFRGREVAFKDCAGKYLTAVGPRATIQSRKSSIGNDELFELMDSKPQVQLSMNLNDKRRFFSTRKGIEVRADQPEVTDKEIFQMEPVSTTDFSGKVKWAFRSQNNNFWQNGATITSDAPDCSTDMTQFEIEWYGDKIAIKASNGKYITTKTNGQLSASSAECLDDTCKFTFQFINRPIIVLRGAYGFVGVKGGSGTLECNRSHYDVFLMTESEGAYSFKGANGKFFQVESDKTLSMNGDKPTEFFLELRALSKMLIRVGDNYVTGESTGPFVAKSTQEEIWQGDKIKPSALWEY